MGPSTARLEVVAGKAAGMSIVVDDELIIGRHAEGAGRLADDDEISRSHARLTVDASGFCAIEDLGSTNGTFVNGLRISAPQVLAEGDTVELGATTLVVRELPKLEPEPPVERTPDARQPTVSQPTPVGVPDGPAAFPGGQEPPPQTEGAGTPPTAPPDEGAPVVPLAAEGAREPSVPAEIESVPLPTAGPVGVPPPLSLQLELDFEAREARLRLGDSTEPVRLVFDNDAWRPSWPPPIEKGTPA